MQSDSTIARGLVIIFFRTIVHRGKPRILIAANESSRVERVHSGTRGSEEGVFRYGLFII
jgi:hypothetical protein